MQNCRHKTAGPVPPLSPVEVGRRRAGRCIRLGRHVPQARWIAAAVPGRELLNEVHETPLSVEDVATAARPDLAVPFHPAVRGGVRRDPSPVSDSIRASTAPNICSPPVLHRSVTEVCFEVGCSSLGSFSDPVHAAASAKSPSVYQRRMRVMVRVPGRRAAGADSRLLQPDAPPAAVGVSQFSRSVPRRSDVSDF